MATIKDVAVAAGVKPATVSYVLNGTGSVSAATKTRVLQAAEALHYQPSHTARSLQRQQSNTLGLVVPLERDPAAWGLIVNGLVDGSTAQGFELLLSTATAGQTEAAVLAELVHSRRVDGVVYLNVAGDAEVVQQGRDLHLPLVCGGRADIHPNVMIDNEAGMVEAVAHLVVRGYQRIALIMPPLEWTLAEEQEQGYRAALNEAGIDWDPAWLVEGGASERGGYDAAMDLLSQADRPDAIIAALAPLAFGTLQAVHDMGLVPGRDIAVLAGDEPRAAAYMDPPLTALRQPYYALGKQLAGTLIARIRGEECPDHTLYPQLIVRRSCGE
ncbi:MAG: LacI family DNA-binding transcriptional regulator [Herpetosiphonaceae bacterium]|nr:LacI family DNA-binding transcriptional regulator [Herpetosiphonaceae bacterium]